MFLENLLAQALCFSLCFAYFRRRIAPPAVTAAFVLALVVFSASFVPESSAGEGSDSVFPQDLFSWLKFVERLSQGEALPGFSLAALLLHSFIGSVLGLACSLGALLAGVVQGWLAIALFGSWRFVEEEARAASCQAFGSLRAVFLLLALVVFFSTPASQFVFYAFVEAYLNASRVIEAGPAAYGIADLIELLGGVVSSSMKISFVVMIPFFLVSFLLDLLSFFYRRFFEQAFSPELLAACRMIVLLFLLALSVYPLRDRIAQAGEGSVREIAKNPRLFGAQDAASAARGGDNVL